jgi:hypothetical protein
MVLRSVGILSCGKVMGAVSALIGLIIGCFMSLIAVAGIAAANQPGQAGAAGLVFGAGAIILLPIFYGIMGFIFGMIYAALYNVIAGVIGGIEMDFTPTADPSVGPPARNR